MKKNWFFIILLYPFSVIFHAVISLRNLFYELGLLKSTSFSLPIINVGNLSVGGTGKTPHIEYLIRLLSPYILVSTISRGYKRKTKGFKLVNRHDNALTVGDEPWQFKMKFPEVPVAVSESRNIGIPLLLLKRPDIQTVLMDDAFQHRSVVPGLNILLTEYSRLFTDDFLLPAGRLREPRTSYHRADIIIVSKCPDDINEDDKARIQSEINPYHYQKIFFSKYAYKNPYFLFDQNISIDLTNNYHIHLISAIANVEYLLDYLEQTCTVDSIIKYEDHHYFNSMELEQFKKITQNFTHPNSIFITTEKDATRLVLHRDYILEHKIPIFVLPIEVAFLDDSGPEFDAFVKQFLLNFKV